MDTEIMETQQIDLSLEIDKDEEYFFAHGELLRIIPKDDAELYQQYVEGGFDLTNYKISPFYDENSRGIDPDKIFSNGALRWKRSVSEVWFYSLNLNHLYASYVDEKEGFGKDGESEFFTQAKSSTGLSKKKISDMMRLCKVYTLKQVFELESTGCAITGLLRLAAPETPREAIQMALAEAKESGTVLTTEVITDIIDFSKNGITSDFEPEIETPSKSDDEDDESDKSDILDVQIGDSQHFKLDFLANGKNRYSVMNGDNHIGLVSKIDSDVWMIEGSNGEPAFKSKQDAAKRLVELSQDNASKKVIDVECDESFVCAVEDLDDKSVIDDLKNEIGNRIAEVQNLKDERRHLLAQLEQLKNEKTEVKKDEIKIPEGAILIPQSQAEVFKQWIKYWGHKHGADTPRGAGIVTALNELKGIISDISDVEIPQCKVKKAK